MEALEERSQQSLTEQKWLRGRFEAVVGVYVPSCPSRWAEHRDRRFRIA